MKLFEVTNTTSEIMAINFKAQISSKPAVICELRFAICRFFRLRPSPRTTTRTVFFSIFNSFWYKSQVCMKPCRPPMTNAHTVLDGTETAFRCFQSSPLKRATICIFKKVNISWGQRSVDAITVFHAKITTLRGQGSRRDYTSRFRS